MQISELEMAISHLKLSEVRVRVRVRVRVSGHL